MRSIWRRTAILSTLVFASSLASAHLVGSSVPLEELARKADLVCKATVVGNRPVTDEWFEPVPGFETLETELRVVSIVKGTASNVIRFRHYAPSSSGLQVPVFGGPQTYTFAIGRTYLVFAAQNAGGAYRQLTKSRTSSKYPGVLLAADAKPHHSTTVSEAVWAELLGLLKSPSSDDAVAAIRQLDEMSGGRGSDLADFDRSQALAAIQPLIGDGRLAIATAAITVFAADSPYFDDEAAPHWFTAFGNGSIIGFVPRKAPASSLTEGATKELLGVATSGRTPELRALAIRALARSPTATTGMVAAWFRDPSIAVRRAAVMASAELASRELITTASTDRSPELRHAAALAIGFTQDPHLMALLDKLLRDPAENVRAAAALSVVSFPINQSGPVMKANLASDFRPVFINALARSDPQPYLPMLAEVIERQSAPPNWWGGLIPAADSWQILFDYVKARSEAELTSGALDPSLDALERMQWFSSSEPRDLYALYLRRGLLPRAKQFRDSARKSIDYNIDYFFDMADRDPAAYVP